jgi:hypothetical protein
MITKALIGDKVRIARTRQIPRLRQRDVDDLVGVPHGRTAHYENGRAAAPHAYLVRLSTEWNIPIGWFLSFDAEDFPLGGQGGPVQAGFGRIELRPELPVSHAVNGAATSIEVEGKFLTAGAFASRISGQILGPKVTHGDLLVFWPTTSARLGVISLAPDQANQSRLVIPTYNVRKGVVELFAPGTDEPAKGISELTAYAVGIVRVQPDGDSFTLTNFEGIRL